MKNDFRKQVLLTLYENPEECSDKLRVIEKLYMEGSLATYLKIRESVADTEETIKICEYLVKNKIFHRGVLPDEKSRGIRWRAYSIPLDLSDMVVDNFNKRHLFNKKHLNSGIIIEPYDRSYISRDGLRDPH